MRFSDSTGKTGLIEDITFWLGVGTAAYPLADRTRCINEHYRRALNVIFTSKNGWRPMDTNIADASSGLPYADQTITSGTALYALPTGAKTIDSVHIKTATGTTFQRVYPMTHKEYVEAGGDGAYSTTTTPTHYMLQGDVLRFVGTPNFTVTDGIRIYFNQGISSFVSTDTTKEPGFHEDFHRILSIGAALDYAIARGLTDKIATLQPLYNRYEYDLKAYCSDRWEDRDPKNLGRGRDVVAEFR